MAAETLSIAKFLDDVSTYILNPLITLVFAIAFLIFVYGIFQFINSETSDKARSQGKQKILWGLVGMTIMFSAYGIIRAIITTIPGAKQDTGYINFGR